MNEKLTGFRTLITVWTAWLLGNLDIVTGAIQQIAEIVNVQLSETGAATALVMAAVSIKQVVTDSIPKLKGD